MSPIQKRDLSEMISCEYGRLDLVEPLYSIAEAIKNGCDLANDLLAEIATALAGRKEEFALQFTTILLALISILPLGRKVIAYAEKTNLESTPKKASCNVIYSPIGQLAS